MPVRDCLDVLLFQGAGGTNPVRRETAQSNFIVKTTLGRLLGGETDGP